VPRCLSCGRRIAGPHPPCGARPSALAPAEELPPAPQVPGYRIERRLGGGGFGAVFAARRDADGAPVALKIARDGAAGAREQLAREEVALRAIGPPAVPALLAAGALADGAPFLALELVPWPTLAWLLEEAGGRFARPRLDAAALAVVDALAALHARGFAHGDVKPENVLVGGEPPRARLLDLGLSRHEAAAGEAGEGFAGTAEYMAPEQCLGGAPDARSDVYAAGVLLFEMASGRPPFFGAPAEVRHAQVNLRPPPPDAPMSAALADVVQRCLAKSPDERFASAVALRAALAAALALDAGPGLQRAPAPQASAAGPRTVQRRSGVVYLESADDPLSVQATAAKLGGTVAHAEGSRYALVFDGGADGGDNPVHAALRAARATVERRVAARARVDLAAVTVRTRPGGADRYLCAAFSDPASWPRADEPAGVLATARAADVLAGTPLAPVPGREGLFAVPPERGPEQATVVRHAPAPLVGREAELDALTAAARAAMAGAPTVAAVVGDAGVGKSHLAAALADRLRALPAAPEVIEVRAAPEGEGGTLGALLRAALDLPPRCAAPADAGSSFLMLALPREIANAAWPAVALALGWLAPDATRLTALGAAPGALVSVAVHAAAALLRRRAARRPLCVVLDDAHLAGGSALDALEAAALAEAAAPLFACAVARPSFDELRPFFGERAAARSRVGLGALSAEAGAALCRRLLAPADGIAAQVVERLVARAGGVPLLLLELVRGLRREGLVQRHPQTGAHYLATDALARIPDMPLVEWLADAELRALPADLAAHARLAALLGAEVDERETAGVLAELAAAGQGAAFPLDAAAALRRLTALGVLVARRAGRIGFRWPLLREAVARSAPDAQRRAIHEAAFRFHQRPGPPELLRLERLARHAVEVGRRGEARAALLTLAADRARRHAWLDAEALYTAALEQLEAGATAERLLALRGRGVMRSRIGRHVDAVADLAAAGAAARALGDGAAEVESLLDEATALDWMNDYPAAEARVAAAAAIALDPTPPVKARLALGRGRALFRAARWPAASAALEQAVALAAAREDEAYETLIAALLLLGGALPPLGRPRDADAALERARRLASERGDLVHLGVVHLNRRNLSVSRGDLEGAVRDQLEALRIAREVGRIDSEYFAEYNLGELFYHAGDLSRAAPHVARAVAIEAAHPEAAPVPLGALLRARSLAYSGEATAAREALAHYRAVVARAVGLGWSGAAPWPNVAVLADAVDLATRAASDAEWDHLLERSARDSIEEEPVEVLELRGLAALRAHRAAEAREALSRAEALSRRIPGLLGGRVRSALLALAPAA
jgi:tetratricopeptide (TPR) repeat protein